MLQMNLSSKNKLPKLKSEQRIAWCRFFLKKPSIFKKPKLIEPFYTTEYIFPNILQHSG